MKKNFLKDPKNLINAIFLVLPILEISLRSELSSPPSFRIQGGGGGRSFTDRRTERARNLCVFYDLVSYFVHKYKYKYIWVEIRTNMNMILFVLEKCSENRKTLPWEHHIGCQMYQIALSKSTKKVKKIYSSYSSDSSGINHATYPRKKSCKLSFFIYFFTFLVLLERAIWHIWQLIWCSKGGVLRFLQCF